MFPAVHNYENNRYFSIKNVKEYSNNSLKT